MGFNLITAFLTEDDLKSVAQTCLRKARNIYGAKLMKLYLVHNAIARAELVFMGADVYLPGLLGVYIPYSTHDRAVTHIRWLNLLLTVGIKKSINKDIIRHIVKLLGTDDTRYLERYRFYLQCDPGEPRRFDSDPNDDTIATKFSQEWPIWASSVLSF